jgi:ABC-type nitrate/sulfonate/bicarbonate transport system substrate-binding protein
VRSVTATTIEFLFDRFLAREGVPASAVRRVNLPAAAVGPAFAHGAVDMALLSDPERTRLIESGEGRLWMPATDFYPGFQLAYVLFGPRLLGPDRALGVRFLRAYLRGVARYGEGKTARNVEVLARRTGLAPALIRACCWVPVRADGSMDPSTLDAFQAWAVATGAMPRPIPLSRILDDGPLREARRGAAGN